ncbi:MAG: hypothetical protein ACK45X_17295 [Roseiflexaceae bacterium]
MTTSSFVQALRHGLHAAYQAVDDTILSDIRANRMRLTGLRSETQILAIGSVLFVVTGILLMFLSPFIRQWFALYTHATDDYVNGVLIPLPSIALIGMTICLAWTLILYASTAMPWWIRVTLTIIHGSLMFIWLIPLNGVNTTSTIICMLALMVVCVATLRRKSNESPWRWIIIFGAEACMLIVSHGEYVTLLNQSGINMLLAGIALMMQAHNFLVIPMMLYVGINMTRAAINFGQWGRLATTDATLVQIGLSVVFIFLLRIFQIPNIRPPSSGEILVALLYLAILGVGAVVLYRMRHIPTYVSVDETLMRYAPWLALLSIVPILAFTMLNFTIGGANMLTGATNATIISWWNLLSDQSFFVTYGIDMLITIGIAAVAMRMWQRQQLIIALYFAVIALMRTLLLIVDQYIQQPLRLNVADTLLFLICVLFLMWKLRDAETRVIRLRQLLSIIVISFFMQQLDFLNNPLSPFFSYAGIFFVGFGFMWDTLVGAGWVNNASPGFPRHARLFGYLGYTLLTITLVMWAGFSLNPDLLALMSGKNAIEGVFSYGFPAVHLLYLVIIITPENAFTTPHQNDSDVHAILAEQPSQ